MRWSHCSDDDSKEAVGELKRDQFENAERVRQRLVFVRGHCSNRSKCYDSARPSNISHRELVWYQEGELQHSSCLSHVYDVMVY